jgi:GalNAc-alpha-(1->4)-GalNAc-alpha-(1->3)-diNAcBac-PP-undecaprenol alpha-1,4-N-acetyl-D-galactosaminyltransferase
VRIALIISSLGAGGAERVMSIMANYWAAQNQDVTLITLSSESSDWYKVHSDVKRVGLNLQLPSAHIGVALRRNVQRIKRLRDALRSLRPDVAIVFGDTTNVLTLIASLGLGIPIIVSERNDPRQQPMNLARGILRSILYRYADAVVVQSPAVRDWAKKFVRQNAIHVIPNPVNAPRTAPEDSCARVVDSVVAMGRLTRQKGFDILLPAFKICAERHPSWSLLILGEGEQRRSLEALVVELGLTGRVRLPGLVQDPTLILRGVDLFIMPSRYEGFPNALLEAMSCGLAVIATDCHSGPREIIRDGIDGMLVPPDDVGALASAMNRLLTVEAERHRLGVKAVEVLERFSVKKIMIMWDELLEHACRAPNTQMNGSSISPKPAV